MWTQGPLRHTGRRPCDEGGRDWSRGHQPRDSSGSTGSQKRQKGPSPAAPGVWPCTHLDFGCLASRALRQNTSVVRSYPIRRDLLRQPEDTHVISSNLAPRLLQEGLLGRQHRQSPHQVPSKARCTTAPPYPSPGTGTWRSGSCGDILEPRTVSQVWISMQR